MFPVREVVAYALLSGGAAAVLMAIRAEGRDVGLYAFAGLGAALGLVLWHLALNSAAPTGLTHGAPWLHVSWSDLGAGLMAYVGSSGLLALGPAREDPSSWVLGRALVYGALAVVVDAIAF